MNAAANPGGNGPGGGDGNAEFDDNCPVPKKEQSKESKTFYYDYRFNDPKKSERSEQQSAAPSERLDFA